MRAAEVFLPRPVALQGDGGGVRLQVVDQDVVELVTEPAPASGVAVVMTDPVEQGYYWRVERLVVSADQGYPDCSVYCASPQPSPPEITLRDYTRFGSRQVAEYARPLLVKPSTGVIVRWTGLPQGARAAVSIQYQLVVRMGG